MSFYQAMITMSVKRFLTDRRVTAAWLAKRMGLSEKTIYAKMAASSPRTWSLDDLLQLAAIGVQIPRIPSNKIERETK
ncbi:hypothetical protein CQ11_01415 [Trueperella pyogenes]|nr:hypothetical protein CQ11_01415 [Trueperella pyogenes]AWA42784.1 hypothetical protein DBV13_01410 [Trueperella pyogenes]AZR03301.1 hypothetical protein EB775_08315 [Trueperella pyogenes]